MNLLLTDGCSDNEGQEDDDFDGQGNECDAVSCSNVCLLGCTPAGSVEPGACTGEASGRCGAGWEALPGDVGCKRSWATRCTLMTMTVAYGSWAQAHCCRCMLTLDLGPQVGL
jgi:hypothetical protein